MYPQSESIKCLTITDLSAMKVRGEKIVCLTAYDASFAGLLDRVGIDVILVGDSLGMVVQGQNSTLPVKIRDMVYHTRCVSTVTRRAMVVADMPFLSYGDPAKAVGNAAKLLQDGGADMVKLEGAQVAIVRHLTGQGVPVCGHLGLLPQSVKRVGGYRVQGKDAATAQQLLDDAQAIEQAGAGLLVLECVPAELGRQISLQLNIPVIGIGAGVDCDGQVLVLYDMLDISVGKRPRFSRNFMQGAAGIDEAVRNYHRAVKQAEFPAQEHCY